MNNQLEIFKAKHKVLGYWVAAVLTMIYECADGKDNLHTKFTQLLLVQFATLSNIQNRQRYVYTHFKSCDQSIDKTLFDFSYIIGATSEKCTTILKLSKSMVT